MIEKYLKNTQFKDDAKDIARQFQKVGVVSLDRLEDSPGLLRSARIWGHALSEVIRVIKEAAEKEAAKPQLKTEISEPAKPMKADIGETK